MHPKRKQKLILVGLIIFGVALASGLTLFALKENINVFFSPSQVIAGEAPENATFRIGGMVVDGSVSRNVDDLSVSFDLTDTAQTVTVSYIGILPDLFREGQGIVAMGQLNDGVFRASQVLAKHDESYMAPEVSAALEAAKKQKYQGTTN